MSRVIERTAFPSTMETKLRQIRWRQVGLAVVRAFAITASVLILAMLVAMLADWWFTLFDTGVRSALTVTSLSLAVATLLATGIKPVAEALGWTRAAIQADAEVPQLEERWTTISHVARSNHQPTTRVAKAMLQQVTSEAVAIGSLVEPARVVRVERLRKVLMMVGACAAGLVGFLAINWEQNSVLMRRFWAPTAAISATQLTSTTGDVAIPRGQSLAIVTSVSGRQRDAATLMMITADTDSNTIALSPEADALDRFVVNVDVEQSFRYRVRAGDGQTPWHSITAIDPPEIAEVRLTVTAPEYVGLPAYEKSLLPGRVKAIQGSHLTLEMRSDAELERFELLLASEDDAGEAVQDILALKAESDGWYRFETILERDISLSPTLFSPFGLTNEDRRVCRIRVIPDKAPVARVISPTEEMSVSQDDVVDIKYEAHDDHGIAQAELVVYEESADGEQQILSVQEIPLDEQQLEKHVLGTAQLDLSAFDLDEGANISYAVRVTDNRLLNVDRETIRSRKKNDSESTASEPKEQQRGDSEAGSTAANSYAVPSTVNEDSTSESTGTESGEPSDQELRLAQADAASSAERPAKDSIDNEGTAASGETSSGDQEDREPAAASAVAESGKEGLRVEDQAHDAARGNADRQSKDDESVAGDATKGDDPSAIAAAGKRDAPAPVEARDSAEDSLVDAAARPTTAENPDEGHDSSEAPLAAAASAKPTADEKNENAAASIGSTNSQTETDAAQVATSGKGGSQRPEDEPVSETNRDPADDSEIEETPQDRRTRAGTIELAGAEAQSRSSTSMPPSELERKMSFEVQRGQNSESNRLRLRITDRLQVAAEAGASRRSATMNTRELLKKIDKELEVAEATLLELKGQSDVAVRPEKFQFTDARLEKAELGIADLRKESKETKYEFVGLQMLDVGRSQVTPARDRMFVLRQDPGSDPARNMLAALHHTAAARELIEALTKQFEEVARERELAEALEEVAKIYEVYVENMQGVLREAQQNLNPLRRKMAVVEVDEAYLDRYREVLEMRRELTKELGRILSDDPRLLGKYMDLIKRRQTSLRQQLTELHERQEDISYELSGWLRVDDAQRPDVWIQVAEMRLLAARPLVKDASQLEARSISQLPLNLEPSAGTSGQVVERAKAVALNARASSVVARTLISQALDDDEAKVELLALADELAYGLSELDAALAQLAIENEGNEETSDFVAKRQAESRTVAEQAIAWAEVASHVRHERYEGLVAVDQQRLAIDTDRLRIAMADIEGDLDGLFRPDDVPPEVINIVRELLIVMEMITFNQVAATYELNGEQLNKAEAQQTMANEGLERAEELFDKMRRTVVDILDEREVDDPNIADLVDPSLDEFLERLEREPNLGQLLGIPDRPSNLRVMRDWMLWQAQGGGMEGAGGQQVAANAMLRAKMLAQRRMRDEERRRRATSDAPLTEEEMRQFSQAEQTEEELERMLRAIQEKMQDPAMDKDRRRELQEKAEMLANMLRDARGGRLDQRKWQELAESDQMKAVLKALGKGEPLPDDQWNTLLSTLDKGLWQVRGRTPPADYRQAIEQYQDQIRRLLNGEAVDAN